MQNRQAHTNQEALNEHASRENIPTSRNRSCSKSCLPWCSTSLLCRARVRTCSISDSPCAKLFRSLLPSTCPWSGLYIRRISLRVPGYGKQALQIASTTLKRRCSQSISSTKWLAHTVFTIQLCREAIARENINIVKFREGKESINKLSLGTKEQSEGFTKSTSRCPFYSILNTAEVFICPGR